MIRLAVVVILIALLWPAFARDFGQWAEADPTIRNWFRSQKSPKTGILCCSEADGVYAEEDIRNGEYWVRFHIFGTVPVDWMRVPPDVVINEPNRHGRAVVWWMAQFNNGKIVNVEIRCFAPGAGI